MPRWLRVLILFLMVLSLVIYISPLQAEASAVAATLVGAATVKVSADLVIPAIAIAIGVAAGTNDDFQNLCSDAASALSGWIQDGYVELVRTIDSVGTQAFYLAGQMMEDFRSYLFSSDILFSSSLNDPYSSYGSDSSFLTHSYAEAISSASITDSYAIIRMNTGELRVYWATDSTGSPKSGYPVWVDGGYIGTDSDYKGYWRSTDGYYVISRSIKLTEVASYQICAGNESDPILTNYSLTLGSLPSQTSDLTDGTSARAWSEDMTDNGLYVVGGSNDPDPPDENNGKWFWPIALALTAADLIAMSQSDQWSGITPGEFDNYEESQNYYITPVEVSFGQGIEISPVTNPDTGGDTGGDTGEDPETDPDTGGEVQTDYTTWFSRLYTTVENISGKFDEIKTTFQTWITDCTTAIEAIPSKFADWFANLKTSVDTFASNAQDAWSQTVTSIQSLPASMVDSFSGLLSGDGTGGPSPPSDHNQFALGDLTKFFPFCIPFDLYDFFTLLRADPVAPVLSWEIRDLSGQTYTLTVDLAEWDSVALLFRRLQLFLFICGLAAASRKYIKW